MLEEFASNCCIATCRILRDVFAGFGYATEAVPCSVHIKNAAMMDCLVGKGPDDDEERLRLYGRLGAWRLDVGPKSSLDESPLDKTRGFEGHVVIRVEQMLVDASLQQLDRPGKRIVMPPLLAIEPGDAFFARPSGAGVMGMENGCSVAYCRLNDYSFQTFPDWLRNGSPYTDVHRTIVRQTRARLGHDGAVQNPIRRIKNRND